MWIFQSAKGIATAIFGFIAAALITGLISANVRLFASKRGLDTYLDRLADHPQIATTIRSTIEWYRRMIAGWEPLQRRWWLWLALGLSGGVAATLWAIPVFESQPPPIGMTVAELHNNALAQAVTAFLAKQNKAPRWGQTDDGPSTVGLGSGTGLADDMFITFWDTSLGRWPSTADGFTPSQLRIFPSTVPKFTTQYDKENFRGAVDALQNIVNQKIGAIVRLSQSLAPIGLTKENEAEFQATLGQITALYQEVDALLFVRGSNGNGRFFDESSYKDLLMGLLPDDWQVCWSNYNVALSTFSKAIALVHASERHPEDTALFDLARTGTGIPKDIFMQETGRLRGFLDRTNQKIDMMIKAI